MKSNCFLLTQDNFIVNLSIAENITLDLKSKINQNILKKSIKLANIDQNIIYRKHKTNLDDLNTESSISGGEKQRVSIARGFYSNRELFILDEPTSNLDPKNTAKIISNIMLELKKKTVIVISHDHLAISKFNKIFKLENGHLKKIK
jgi:ABC-type bacteriocin/lantibiotic exporter with double-glycine peptidase domain